jgi:hypothetical protein
LVLIPNSPCKLRISIQYYQISQHFKFEMTNSLMREVKDIRRKRNDGFGRDPLHDVETREVGALVLNYVYFDPAGVRYEIHGGHLSSGKM